MASSSTAQQRTVYQFLKLSLCVCVWGVLRQYFNLQPVQAGLKLTIQLVMAMDSQHPSCFSFPSAGITDRSHLTLKCISTAEA